MMRQLELVVRRPGQMERRVPLAPGSISLGRGEMNDVVLSDIGVSRRHARLHVGQEGVLVEDAGSGNGTWFRGQRVNRQILGPGDEVVIEPFTLCFEDVGSDAQDEPRSDSESTIQSTESRPGARLTVISGHKVDRRDHLLPALGTITLGRSEKNLIVLPEPSASRVHAEILCGDIYTLRDLGSSNGTYVNGKRIRSRVLADGDRLRIGSFEMRFGTIPHEVPEEATDATEQFEEVLAEVPLTRQPTRLTPHPGLPAPPPPAPDPVPEELPPPLLPSPRRVPAAEPPPLMPGQPDEPVPRRPPRRSKGVPAWVPLVGLFAFGVVVLALMCAGVVGWEIWRVSSAAT